MPVDMQLLYEHVAWCVWHEGLRLYDNGVPGHLNDVNALRNACLKLQQHNGNAGALISAASNNELMSVLGQTESRVEKEHNLTEHFRWVAYHESRRAEMLNLLSEGKYSEIRSLYYNHQNHNSNARHLLSCVSNGYIVGLINDL